MEYIKLSQIDEGMSGIVEYINCPGDIKRRFMDLGLIKGTKISCVLVSSYNSIKAYLVRGNVIAIRKCDADCILVKGCGR